MAAQRSSIAVGVSRASLTLATAFALTRVFAGRSWLFVMVVGAVVPPLFLGWAQRRHWHPLIRLAVITGGGIWLSALVADPKNTFVGVPSRATLSALAHELNRAPHTLRAAVVPVPPVASALVLAFLGVFVVAALTEWIAMSLDAPIGAFAPSIALFIVVAAMGGNAWVAPTALYTLAALAVLIREGGQLTVVACVPEATDVLLRTRRLRRPFLIANGTQRPLTESWNEAVVRWQPNDHRSQSAYRARA